MTAAQTPPASSAVTGVVLDVDGTLLDTTFAHVDSWQRALRAHGHRVPAAQIHRRIGMGGGRMLHELLGDDLDDGESDRLSAAHGRFLGPSLEELEPLPGARELVAALQDRGLRVALATSAKAEVLPLMLDVLDLGEGIEVVDAGDVENTKPDPEVLHDAAQRLDLPPERCVMVGDAVWDMVAAVRAGMTGVGVRSGGIGAAALREAGAAAVYDDPAHILRELEDSPLLR